MKALSSDRVDQHAQGDAKHGSSTNHSHSIISEQLKSA